MKRPGPGPGDPQHGLTLVELLFAMAMFGVLLVVVVRFTSDTRFGLMRNEAASELSTRNRILASNLRATIHSNRLLLPRSSVYDDVRAIVKASPASVSGTPLPVAFSLSPQLVNAQEPQLLTPPSATSGAWGNELLMVANLPPVQLTVCYSGCVGAPNSATIREEVSVARLQFVYLYLAQDPSHRVPGLTGGGLRLVEWRSQPFLNYNTLDYSAPRLTGTVKAALAQGYTSAVSHSSLHDAANAFYTLQNNDVTPLANLGAPAVLSQSHWAYVDEFDLSAHLNPRPGLNRGRIRRSGGGGDVAGPSNIVIALNTYQPSVNPTWKAVQLRGPGRQISLPRYATPDNGAANFPAGFEVGIFGKPNARQVIVNHVLMATGGYGTPSGQYLAHEAQQNVAVDNE